MQGIHPSNSAAQPPQHLSHVPVSAQANGAHGSAPLTQAAAGQASSTSLVAHSSTTVTFVSQQVDMMLANIGEGMSNQQTLRLMIALLILQELLNNGNGNGNGNGDRNGSAAELLGLLNGNGNGNGSASMAALSSQSTMMQVHHEQTLALSHQSVQGAALSQYAGAPGNGHERPGQATDMTA